MLKVRPRIMSFVRAGVSESADLERFVRLSMSSITLVSSHSGGVGSTRLVVPTLLNNLGVTYGDLRHVAFSFHGYFYWVVLRITVRDDGCHSKLWIMSKKRTSG